MLYHILIFLWILYSKCQHMTISMMYKPDRMNAVSCTWILANLGYHDMKRHTNVCLDFCLDQ